MIVLTIILGVTALLGAYAAGLMQTWIGTAATSAIVLLLVIAAPPSAWWLFDDAAGWVTTWHYGPSLRHYTTRCFTNRRRWSRANADQRRLLNSSAGTLSAGRLDGIAWV